MRNKIIIALVAMLAILGLGAQNLQAVAADPKPIGKTQQIKVSLGVDGKFSKTVDGRSVPMSSQAVTDYRYTGTRFGSPWICQEDYTNSSTPIASTGDAFENGSLTVIFGYRYGPTQDCTGYTAAQQIFYRLYQAADGSCGSYIGPATAVADPQNPYYTQIWAGTVIVSINAYYASCRGTAQRRANVASRMSGGAAGLDEFYNTSTAAIMNIYYQNVYSTAGAFDRNNLYFLY